MVTYADSSFLVSLYRPDAHTPVAEAEMAKLGVSLPITALQLHEVRNAIRLGVFQQLINSTECQAALLLLDQDIRNGVLEPITIQWTQAFREAERIGNQFIESFGVRAADLLHVATARVLGASRFRTFDKRQEKLAKSLGFN